MLLQRIEIAPEITGVCVNCVGHSTLFHSEMIEVEVEECIQCISHGNNSDYLIVGFAVLSLSAIRIDQNTLYVKSLFA